MSVNANGFSKSPIMTLLLKKQKTYVQYFFFLKKMPILEFIQQLRADQVAVFGLSALRQRFSSSPYEVAPSAVWWFQKIPMKSQGLK